MGRDSIGHRGSGEDEWRRPTERLARLPGWRRRGPGGPAGVVLGLVILAAGLSLGFYVACRGDDGTPVATPTASPTAAPGVTTTAATPTFGGGRFRLTLWADELAGWRLGDLDADASSYREGQTVPFLLRIDGVEPGEVYSVGLRYDCQVDEAAAFDFLTGYERDTGSGPALAEQGPGRSQPDATIGMPDDLSIAFDDEEQDGRVFRLWGATFDDQLVGRGLDVPCTGSKVILLRVRALAKTVFLIWGGHLGSSKDWGANRGAASQDRPFGIAVAISGLWPQLQGVSVVPGAISP